MCSSKLRCVYGTHFGSNLRCACVRCITRLAKCNHNIAHYFGKNERTDDENLLSFDISYDFSNFSKKVNF